MDQSRQYDDLRGEWAQVWIEYAHNFTAKLPHALRDKSEESGDFNDANLAQASFGS